LLETTDGYGTRNTLRGARSIIENFDEAFKCLNEVSYVLNVDDNSTEEQVKDILHNHKHHISNFEDINVEDCDFETVDLYISDVQRYIDDMTYGILGQLPGVKSDDCNAESLHFSKFVELLRHRHQFQFVFPLQNLKRIRTVAHTLRNILEGHWDVDAFQETLNDLRAVIILMWEERQEITLDRQLWRLQDLSDGGGLGFTVELFFLTLKQLSLAYPSNESHSALYIGTFRAITSDWSKYGHSLGTQKLLLDMVMSDSLPGIVSNFSHPTYILEEFLVILGKILEGKTGPHIDAVVQHLAHRSPFTGHTNQAFFNKVLEVLTRARGQPP
jgi:hypothetical protein